MLANAKNAELYGEFARRIEVDDVRDAYHYIVGLAATLTEFTCHPQYKGDVRDFRFMQGNEQPFAFIVNKNAPLKFYFRAPAIRSGRYSRATLQHPFPDATENNRGEWTMPLTCIGDVRHLWCLLAVR